jgi:hypothetical protein
MPYRRLPNTDIARQRALKSALKAGEEIPPFKLAFSQPTLQKLRSYYPSFENMMMQQRAAITAQTNKSRELGAISKKAKLYVSHFFQVLNMAIMRGEISPASRKFYGLRENDSRIPMLNTEKDLIYWGEKAIKGEAERLSNGGNPVTNPTAAVVRVRYEQYLEATRYQKVLQKSTAYATDRISALRAEADGIILNIWNEVEATFDLLPEEARRDKANRYGVVYVFRPYEREVGSAVSEETIIREENEYVSESEILQSGELRNLRKEIISEEESLSPELQYAISFTGN